MLNPQRRNGALPHSPELALNRDALADEEDADVPDSINRARIGASTNLADTPAAIQRVVDGHAHGKFVVTT